MSCPNGACSLAAVKSKGAKKKRKRGQDDSDEADEFSESDSELGEHQLLCVAHCHCCSDSLYTLHVLSVSPCLYISVTQLSMSMIAEVNGTLT